MITARNSDILVNALSQAVVFPRQVLNKLRWKEGESLAEAVIWYVHRGVPGDVLRISGDRVKALDRGFFDTDEATIPYHRILRIDHRGATLFEKDKRAKGLV